MMQRRVIPPAAAKTLGSANILLVEDDPGIGNFLKQNIEEDTPYNITVVYDGEQALEKAQHIHPCLLMLNYRLPGMNGLQVYDHLQTMNETKDVPVIMMSATLPIEELQRRGIYQLRKPTDPGNVIRIITHALATYEEQRLGETHQSL